MPETARQKPSALISIRIDLVPIGRLGPGKVELLEAIEASGSISGAGRAMAMSYRRAWLLVDNLNRMFRQPLVEAAPGGAKGGGAHLTPMGREIVAHYRAIESKAMKAAALHIDALRDAAAEPTS
ncbi:molybdate transport system regulatory protein [Bosea sp. OK403]|uniref:Molybdate transport system regulatory protein n=1 Tax=Bosea psychrotolerans TaxID=1871628 RepID=A0A2S4LZ76_9HYPH|nr:MULTISPECIES: LysR family transcriptional regulator [Bosea]POR47764.1 molybdate transport system regulatory protein [Bosea psychrotolerans]WNJ93752.1 LysR family transcriptional regulator [Bosea sp. 685]SFI01051.1 molybdate transport system regulatory protein [Bosea sp. OK403]